MTETMPASGDDTHPSRRRATLPRWVMVGIAVGLGLVVAYGAAWLLGPRPDATLTRFRGDAVTTINGLSNAAVDVDVTTLEPYEAFMGLEPWYATDYLGNPCLLIIEPGTRYPLAGACTPPEADLIVDVGVWPAEADQFAEGLPDGTVIRFQLHRDAIDVYVHRPAEQPDR
ncbi:hypothetical protein [Microbacterium sp. NPDC058389]|uniref:hypothetical protein n=1 Tax=Microbacterium sp. NPDC058389 TaxID=3346475 RepID=UPI00365D4779